VDGHITRVIGMARLLLLSVLEESTVLSVFRSVCHRRILHYRSSFVL
jgi:hypothetical protein